MNSYLAMIDLYKEQMETIETQVAYLQTIINDYTKAKVTIENLEKNKYEEILIPIGGGVFLPARCGDVSSVLVSESSDVVIKKSLNDAKESIEKKISNMQETMKKLGETYSKIQEKIDEISNKLRGLLEEREKGQEHV